jgi:ABC-type transport system involved in multi-copper enzyme maturation permease subunit
MIRLIRVELLKIRTTRLGYGLLAAAAGLTVLFSILEANSAGGTGGYSPPPLYTPSGFSAVTGGGIWCLVFAAVLGVTISSGEFRHHTATLTYLAAPARTRVLVAKAAAGALGGAIFGLTGFAITLGTGLGFTASDGYRVPVSDATMASHGAGALLAGALLAAIGVAAGSLVRSQLAAVIGVFAWAIIIESLIGGLFTSVRPYLPYTAATTMAGSALGGAAFGPAHGVGGGTPLPFLAAAALLAAIAAALAAIAAATMVRRDIT